MINSVTLLGNLGRDPEIRSTQSGVAIANLSLATNRRWKDRNDGGTREQTEARRNLLSRPEMVASYLTMKYAQPDQEVMGALYLNGQNRLIAEHELFRGTLKRTAVEPRTIITRALLCSAKGFILFHTHPSGDPAPSQEDLTFTKRVIEAGDLLNVKLLDHMILGDPGRWISLSRRGV